MTNSMGYLFWGFLIVYGIVMMILSPKHVTTEGFFHGKSKEGHEPTPTVLMLSIFISWILRNPLPTPPISVRNTASSAAYPTPSTGYVSPLRALPFIAFENAMRLREW